MHPSCRAPRLTLRLDPQRALKLNKAAVAGAIRVSMALIGTNRASFICIRWLTAPSQWIVHRVLAIGVPKTRASLS